MPQNKINWYYVYSQRYEALHHMLKASITDPRFQVVPLFVDQSEFNKTTYAPGADHFLSGCMIKEEVILQILRKMETNTYCIFTDVDIVLLKQDGLFEYFQTHMERGADLTYMWENSDTIGHSSGYTNYNIGISLLRANEKTIAFYEKVVQKGNNNRELADQEVVCSLLAEFDGTMEIFHRNTICLSNYFNETEPKSTILLIQVLCGNSKNYKENMMQKYMGAKAFGVPMEHYLQQAIENGRTPEELGVT